MQREIVLVEYIAWAVNFAGWYIELLLIYSNQQSTEIIGFFFFLKKDISFYMHFVDMETEVKKDKAT